MDSENENGEEEEEAPRPPRSEGVRIIGADEAAAALESGQAAGRRPEDAPRFGDVPRTPEGPRPAHRFPLPEAVDPSRVLSAREEADAAAGPADAAPGGAAARGTDGLRGQAGGDPGYDEFGE